MHSTLTDSDIAAYLQRHQLLRQTHTDGRSVRKTVQSNSKQTEKGCIFVAYKGVSFDSHTVLADVVALGAGFIVLDDEKYIPTLGGASYALVTDSREALSFLAALINDEPQDGMVLVGVTGTNGKSSTVWFVRELFSVMGIPILTIGTLGAFMGEERLSTEHTTPDPTELFSLLRKAKERGIRHVCMEVSSHSIAQKRIGPLQFSAVAFTSFSRDHLDYHASMEEYFAAKWELFSGKYLKPDALRLVNDKIGIMPGAKHVVHLRYGFGKENEVAIRMQSATSRGSELSVSYKDATESGLVPLLAGYAAENFSAALVLASHVSGRPLVPASKWMQIRDVPGRLERVRGPNGSPDVFVDYAHTPDSLEQSLKVLRPITPGTLWVVFGCGGDRDAGKRPLMGKVAIANADRVVVTSDNPRTEDPNKIIQDIVSSLDATDGYSVVVDREKAIGEALARAQAGDCVLIAGKGHEDYQIIGKDKKPFDDRKVAADSLRKKK
ncbi:MAG: UDP-N-acetylmuramoyl-L-alanyl-D-glutamate--2,6-diaminopimelate ligase [Oligoflexales bacterium]